MMTRKQISPRKIAEVQKLTELLNRYRVIGLVSMEKINAKSIQEIRKELRGKALIRMSKKRLIKRALKQTNKPNLEKLGDLIRGSSALILTDMNPIKLAQFLKSKATRAPAKPGDIAPEDIVVPAGNTNLPPGPIISELQTVLKLPTMIKNSQIHVKEDTVTHKKGDVIDLKASLLLARLGIEPMEVVLDLYAAWEDGEIIPEEVLKMDENKLIEDVKTAYQQAFSIALNLELITEETIVPLIQKAVREANAIILEAGIITEDTLPAFIAKAYATAKYIEKMVLGDEEEIETAEEKKEEEKDDDEVMGAGISALFD
ncbi:MAG: 50S ribosomal protein L10 [Promethearchaeota archaeon]